VRGTFAYESADRRAGSWLWLAAAVTWVLTLNPWTAKAWWLRRPFVPPLAAGLGWTVDAAVLVAGAALMRRRRRRIAPRDLLRALPSTLALLTFGLLLALLALEGLLRLFPTVALPPSVWHELRWQRLHRTPAAPAQFMGLHVYSPTLGWEPGRDVRTSEVNSNSHGLRGMEEYPRQPVPGVRRAVCVGDSFIFGDGLLDTETMPSRLAVELNRRGSERWDVLNLGVDGYGTDQQWLRLETVGFGYHPDVVVLGFFEEDVGRNVLGFRDYAKPYFDLTDGDLLLRNVPVPTPEEVLARQVPLPSWYTANLVTWVPEALTLQVSSLEDLAQTRAGRVTLAILNTMRQATREHGATLVLIVIPRPITGMASDTEHMLVRWARETETPVLNLREEYLKLPEARRANLYWNRTSLYHGHWTPYGATVTAQALAPKVAPPAP
jgi:hypothetical protein